jgi:hypothetical protein
VGVATRLPELEDQSQTEVSDARRHVALQQYIFALKVAMGHRWLYGVLRVLPRDRFMQMHQT